MCVVYRNPETMGNALPEKPAEFFQLYVYIISVVCVIKSNTIFALYSNDERPRKTVGTRYDMEECVHGVGLGIFSYGLAR